MNPQSAYYLSFNTGYPNAFDKALGRTGSQLMVHGDCSSRGCYAMTDEQIAEIYSLGRESFFGGQKSFQLQAYPFKMTPVNMAKHRNNPNMPFWKMIKEGYDHFEVTRQEPKVDFCEKKYVFDAAKAPNATRDPVFDASAKCPAYVIPDEIADAVREKQQHGRGRDRQADRQGNAGGADQHRHRRRHEQGVRRQAARRQHRPVRRRRRPEPVAAGAVARARHHPFAPSIRRARPPTICCWRAGRADGCCGDHVGATPRPTRVASAAPATHSRTGSSPALPARSASAAPPTRRRERAAAAAKPKVAEAKPQPSVVRAAPKPERRSLRKPGRLRLSRRAEAFGDRCLSDRLPRHRAAAQVAGSAPIVSSNSFDSRFGAVK